MAEGIFDDDLFDEDDETEETGTGEEDFELDDNEAIRALIERFAREKALIKSADDDEEDDDDDETGTDDWDWGDDDEEDDDDFAGFSNANDYHNKGIDYSRTGQFKKAIAVCEEGIKRYPYNVDLIADTIKYSMEAGDKENAAKHFALLKERIPYKRFNWRAYTFSFDYLVEDLDKNEKECRELIDNYKKYLPNEEKAVMAESELEEALGNYDRSMEVLKEAVSTRHNACQCALRLADMQCDIGLFEEAQRTIQYGLRISVNSQPSINIPYLMLLNTLVKDSLLHKKEEEQGSVDKKEVESLAREYRLLLEEFPGLSKFMAIIKIRSSLLKFMNAVEE